MTTPHLEVTPIACLRCRQVNNCVGVAAGDVTLTVPVEGDVAVCMNCCDVAIYTGSPVGGLRHPTPAELPGMQSDPDLRQLVTRIRRRVIRKAARARRIRRQQTGG